MPKLKSKSGAKKRFKLTASGKVKFAKSNRRHILTSKTTKVKRHGRASSYLSGADAEHVRGMLLGC